MLVVFTDGEDQGSRTTFADAQRRVGETEALVYMVGTGRALDRETFRREMRTLSEPTGGRAIFTDDIEKLRDAFRELVQELSTQYPSFVRPLQPSSGRNMEADQSRCEWP